MTKRALRADAERNRRQILQVAQEVFAQEGIAVPIDEIARRAGLGVGTLYRHFPTKEALFCAIVVTKIEELTERARGLLERNAPVDDFFALMSRLVDRSSRKKDLMDALAHAGVDLKDLVRAKKELHKQLEALLERAQHAGAIRTDVTMPEIFALLFGASGALDRPGATGSYERVLAIVFDGLRPPAPPARARTGRRAAR